MRFCRSASIVGLGAIGLLALGAVAWSAPIEITTGSNSHLGSHLTESGGTTVYLFTGDKKGKSNCEGACAKAWPPVMTSGAPTAGSGVTADKLGTIKRGDEEQVTYDGMPLYNFIRDKSPGLVNGEGINHFGGSWYVVAPDGKAILPDGKQKDVSSGW